MVPVGNTSFLEQNSTSTMKETDLTPYLPEYGHYIAGIYLLIVGFLGFSENGIVIIIFLKCKRLRSPTNTFLLSLAVNDFLMSTMGIPLVTTSSLATRWLYGKSGCDWEAFSVYFLGLASIYNLAGISMGRYVVIAKPLGMTGLTHRAAVMMVVGSWCFAFLWAIFPVIGWSEYGLEGAHTSCSVVWQSRDPLHVSYTMTIYVFCFMMPLCAISFSYFQVFRTIRTAFRNSTWDKVSRVAQKNLRVEKRMARTLGFMVLAFIVSWTPYAVVSLWSAVGDPNDISVVAGMLPAILAKTAIIWNPIIYVATNKEFRHAFYTIIPCSGLKNTFIKKAMEKELNGTSTCHNTVDETVATMPYSLSMYVLPGNVVSPSTS